MSDEAFEIEEILTSYVRLFLNKKSQKDT